MIRQVLTSQIEKELKKKKSFYPHIYDFISLTLFQFSFGFVYVSKEQF